MRRHAQILKEPNSPIQFLRSRLTVQSECSLVSYPTSYHYPQSHKVKYHEFLTFKVQAVRKRGAVWIYGRFAKFVISKRDERIISGRT